MQCACHIAESDDKNPLRLNPCPEHERWAKAIRDYEREACATVAEQFGEVTARLDGGMKSTAAAGMFNVAAAIRARGKQ